MKVPRKLVVGLGIGFALVLSVLLIIPAMVRGPVTKRVHAAIASSVTARVTWGDVGLSLFRDFPNLTFRVDDFRVTGVDRFQGDTLVSVGRFRLVLDLSSVVRNVTRGQPVVVRSIELDRPMLSLKVLDDGAANWDIIRKKTRAPGDETPSDVAINLRRFRIDHGSLTFEDPRSGTRASIDNLSQTLTGDFRQDRFVLSTRAAAGAVSANFSGVPFLSGARLDLQANIGADMPNRRFTFAKNRLRLNDLELNFSGSAGVTGDSTLLDLAFRAPSTDFRHILSLVPTIYAHDFAKLKTTGTMAVAGRINGVMAKGRLPAFGLEATVADGTFRYPDLPLPARDIALKLSVNNPGGDVDKTVVDLQRMHVVIGNDPVDATLVLRTPVSDPDVDVRVAGKVDLEELRRTVKLDKVSELTGVLSADAALHTRKSFIDRAQYDRVRASGAVDARGLTLRTADLPHALAIDEAQLRLSPEHARLTTLRGRIGSSDIAVSGYLDNLIGFMLRDESLRGRANIQSQHFDLNEWRSEKDGLEVIPVPAKLDFALEANVARLKYGTLELTDARGAVHVKDQRITLEDFTVNTFGGQIGVTGFYETTDLTRPTFDAQLRMASLDIPAAFKALVSVRTLAPVARYAEGNFSANVAARGTLGRDMMPLFDKLDGQGALETSRLVIQDFPALAGLADALKIRELANPTLNALRSTFTIEKGRLHVRPFDVRLGEFQLGVTGSNGFDQSLDYTLKLQVPRARLGAEANKAITALATNAGKVGLDLTAADMVEVTARLTGTVTAPTIRPAFSSMTTSARETLEKATRQAVETRVENLERRADALADTARSRIKAQADSLVQEMERRAEAVREEARRLADRTKAEAYARADSLVARATNPVARSAAQLAAKKLRGEADETAARIVREADRRADDMVAESRKRADQLRSD